MAREPVHIANGQGFWGDSILGPVRLVREGPLDYLTLDYLAEVTMSIMQKLKRRDPNAGYATDFVDMLDRILPEIVEKDIKVIANAGGVNPQACRQAVFDTIKKHGFSKLKVAVVEGDDILDDIPSLMAQGETFASMDSGEPLSDVRDRLLSANVYIGAEPVVEALAQGAQIVIAGRCTDPSLVVAPMIHEFGWSYDDWDKLAAATVAGHIVECGAQCTGGNYTYWRDVPGLARVGYPVIAALSDGTFEVTKHEGTGGLCTVETVASQLVYEMGDPSNYVTPDVIADFTSIKLEPSGPDRVRLSGIKGAPRPDKLKVSASYLNGFKAVGQLTISGPDAAEKANLCADIIFDRLKMDGVEFAESQKLVELVGTSVCYAGMVPDPSPTNEVVLRVGVKDPDRSNVDRFGREIAPLVTSGPPGVTGFAGGRPRPTEIIAYWPALVSREPIETRVSVEEV